jgi:hypothetical protein
MHYWHARAKNRTRAHLEKSTASDGGEVGNGGEGGGIGGRDKGRRADAFGGRRDARRSACEAGSSSHRGHQWGRMG